VPSLSASANTEINMYYGNSSITSNPSSTSTWNSDYIMNMHMDDISTSGIGNSSAQTFTGGSIGSMTSGDIVTGKIGSGLDFDGSNDGIKLADNNTIDLNTNDFSFSCWFKTDAIGNTQVLFNKKPTGGGVTGFGAVLINTSGQLGFYFKGSSTTEVSGTTSTTVSASTWYNFHITCDVSNDEVKIYLNGSLVSTTTVFAGATLANGHHQFFGIFANYNANSHSSYAQHPFNGILDEMRVSLTNLSSDWIATEYTNQNSPSNFYSVSTHQSATSGLPVELIHLDAYAAANHRANLNWATASETNNSHFEIEHSYDGKGFETVGQVSGNGNSQHQIEYSFLDKSISKTQNKVFYRLKQVDFDGAYEYSEIRVVRFDKAGNEMQLMANPNPFSDEVTIMLSLSEGENYHVQVTDLNGAVIHQEDHTFTNGIHHIDLSQRPAGMYTIEVASDRGTEHIKVMKK
jgi:hypothetical protein